ncbi:MAG: hypothetical protein JO086_09940, partial [Acidimicrobiia bacterium]|nr:hypothetical protein [Acidimicrobiia bacterium]
MSAPQYTLAPLPVSGVQVGGVHFAPASIVSGGAVGGVGGAGVLAFTGVGPGTLPLAIAGLASILAGGAAVLFGRDKKGKGSIKRPKRKFDAA